jgi:hypothetical protein
MKKGRKPTRRWIARRMVYAEIRQYVKAELEMAEHKYGTDKYRWAHWKSDHHYGRAMGGIDMAVAVGALEYGGFSESFRLERRIRQAADACANRKKKLIEARARQTEEGTSP